MTALQSQLNLRSRIVKLQLNSAIGTLNSLIVGVNGQPGAADMNDLQNKPGATELINSLPDNYKAELPFMLGKAVSIPPSATQEAAYTWLVGHMNTNPTQVADIDLSKFPLSPKQLSQVTIQMQQIKGNEAEIEANTKRLIGTPAAQNYIKLNFPKAEDRVHNPEYDQFVGALLGKTRAFMSDPANNGKYPQTADFDKMVSDLTQEHTVGGFLGLGAKKVDNGYVVPGGAAAYIRKELLAQGVKPSDITDTEVARQFFINPAHHAAMGIFYLPNPPTEAKK